MAPITVLLVDDSSVFRGVAVRFLEEHSGSEVVVVGSVGRGEEALVEAERLRPQVVLVDLRMPGMNGIETIRGLRRLLPEAGIIALSLLRGEAYQQAVLAVGASDFVSKQSMVDDLLPAIRRAIALQLTTGRGAPDG
jgi:DNA-binding NarL/FixJ family response regulator